MSDEHTDPFVASVRVGPKGQIVIPGEARKCFGINPGDILLVLVNPGKGMAIRKMAVVRDLVEQETDSGDDYRQAAAEALGKVKKG